MIGDFVCADTPYRTPRSMTSDELAMGREIASELVSRLRGTSSRSRPSARQLRNARSCSNSATRECTSNPSNWASTRRVASSRAGRVGARNNKYRLTEKTRSSPRCSEPRRRSASSSAMSRSGSLILWANTSTRREDSSFAIWRPSARTMSPDDSGRTCRLNSRGRSISSTSGASQPAATVRG